MLQHATYTLYTTTCFSSACMLPYSPVHVYAIMMYATVSASTRTCHKEDHADKPARSCRNCYLDNAAFGVAWGIFCVHARQASRCHEGECKGAGICEHSVLLIQCAKCAHGQQKCFCQHNVRAKRCLRCWKIAQKRRTSRPSGLCYSHGKIYCTGCCFPKHAFAKLSADEDAT